MKTIGLIGGMSFESSAKYYQLINDLVREKLGGLHSAKSIMYSVDFDEIEQFQREGEWEKTGDILGQVGKKLEYGGADFIILCTNTMHKVYRDIEKNINIPFLHIADATGDKIIEKGIKKIGLLGTKYTMEQDFYIGRLEENYQLEVIVPDEVDRNIVNKVIFEELVVGNIREESKKSYLKIIDKLKAKGAEGIILGCTEIGLLIEQNDVDIPVFDTTYIHALKAVEYALDE